MSWQRECYCHRLRILSATDRYSLGKKVAIVGLGVNFILFTLKLFLGLWSYSLTVLSDAVNNLADFLTSLITLFSFRIAGRPADRRHPFGHARSEYIASLLIAVFIMAIGVQLIRSGIEQFFFSSLRISITRPTIIILACSVLLKSGLYYYQYKIAGLLNSLLIKAAANDSLNDVYVGLSLVVAAAVAYYFNWHIDALIGLSIGLIIIVNGYILLRQTCDKLLGNRPSKQLRQQLRQAVLEYDDVLGVHDLMIHDYGPDHCYASIHVEVDAEAELLSIHHQIDQIERQIRRDYDVQLLIHIDPMLVDDKLTESWHQRTQAICQQIDEKIFLHEFRCRQRHDYVELMFDIAIPDSCNCDNSALRQLICQNLQRYDASVKAYITIDRHYATDLAIPDE